jgi:hypothetical protein
MLAYAFWHRPAAGAATEAYEDAVGHFHRSLHSRPPAGFVASACFRAEAVPWLGGDGYEDWYLVENWAALGVLNEAAVAHGHRSRHDEAARHSGDGAGGLFRLLEGEPDFASVRLAVWVTAARGRHHDEVAALLADGMHGSHGGLWQRQLTLGPSPEYCLLAASAPAGVAPTRLDPGWNALCARREQVA